MYLAVNVLFILFLLIVGIYDMKTSEIPNVFAIIALVFGVFACFAFPDITLVDRIIGAFSVSGFLFIMSMIIPGSFGGGDIKLMVGCGLYLGWQLSTLSLVFAILSAGLVSVFLLVLKKKDRKDHIPFGPSLCVGMILSMFVGERIISWYLTTYWGFL